MEMYNALFQARKWNMILGILLGITLVTLAVIYFRDSKMVDDGATEEPTEA